MVFRNSRLEKVPWSVKDTGRRFGLHHDSIITVRVRTETKMDPFFCSRALFPLSSFLLPKSNCLYHFHPLHLFFPNYMSSYRKTMPSFTLVLTSGHPSFRLPTIQPSSAMVAPDFLMVHIWPSMSNFYSSIDRKPLIHATILWILDSMRSVRRMLICRPFSKRSKRILTRSKYVCF